MSGSDINVVAREEFMDQTDRIRDDRGFLVVLLILGRLL